jgi:hypothetical protein
MRPVERCPYCGVTDAPYATGTHHKQACPRRARNIRELRQKARRRLRAAEQEAQCSECNGTTIEFRGTGLDRQYKICSRYQEPGHLSEQRLRDAIRDAIVVGRPSGRFA